MGRTTRMLVVLAVVAAVVVVLAAKRRPRLPSAGPRSQAASTSGMATTGKGQGGLPRLLDLGSVTCIPCKMMAPILDELRAEHAGTLDVEFVDVRAYPEVGKALDVGIIPTQVFFDASGRELFRHEGFYSKADILAKWQELGVDLSGRETAAFERLVPARPDTRPREAVCYMCDDDVDPRTRVIVRTEKGDVRLCSPHCYFIMYSCLTEDRGDFEQKVAVTDYTTGEAVPALDASYLYGLEPQSGQPWIRAFATRGAADREMQSAGGSVVGFDVVRALELSNRCGFCDRACYSQDAAEVIAGGVHTWGCCSHCALGVAARTGLDIEVRQPDRLTGEIVVVRTVDGNAASIEPETAVAWFGLREKPDGTWGSAGCFHQGFFATEANLRRWVDANPYETGRQITIHKALADKMALTPQQIVKACKIGECAPK